MKEYLTKSYLKILIEDVNELESETGIIIKVREWGRPCFADITQKEQTKLKRFKNYEALETWLLKTLESQKAPVNTINK